MGFFKGFFKEYIVCVVATFIIVNSICYLSGGNYFKINTFTTIILLFIYGSRALIRRSSR